MTTFEPPRRLRLQSRRRTDPRVTLSAVGDLVSPLTGIVREVREELSGNGLPAFRGYNCALEELSLFRNAALMQMRHSEPMTWKQRAEGRAGNRMSHDREHALVRAMGEAVERYACGLWDPASLVTAAHDELGETAVHVDEYSHLAPHEYTLLEGRYARPYVPFDAASPMRWAWAWSLTHGRHRLVPAHLTYLYYNAVSSAENVMPANSTGWAVANTIEEAVLTGMIEHAERDGFFISWLNRTPLPEVDLDTVEDPDVIETLASFEETGVEPRVFLTTNDLGIPAFAAFLVARRGPCPPLAVGLGAALRPAAGIRKALEEAAMLQLYFADLRLRGSPPVARMEDVHNLHDHPRYYFDPRRLQACDFLLRRRRQIELQDVPDLSQTDVLDEINVVQDAFTRAGMDVLVVENTLPDVEALGLRAVRVVVPAAQGHGFGYGLRFLGGDRVFQVPIRMGQRDEPLAPEQMNLSPHPIA